MEIDGGALRKLRRAFAFWTLDGATRSRVARH
jgi:hypothetical protein